VGAARSVLTPAAGELGKWIRRGLAGEDCQTGWRIEDSEVECAQVVSSGAAFWTKVIICIANSKE